jgi:hypothetical protein
MALEVQHPHCASNNCQNKKTRQTHRLWRVILVDLRGFEPLTPCMPCRCATSCAIGPSITEATCPVYNKLGRGNCIEFDDWTVLPKTL